MYFIHQVMGQHREFKESSTYISGGVFALLVLVDLNATRKLESVQAKSDTSKVCGPN